MCSRVIVTTAVVISSLILSAGPALAGHDHARGGFFIGFGLGGGTATPDADVDREGGGAGVLRIGYAPKDELTLGMEAALWSREVAPGVTWMLSTTTFGVTYYPGNNGFYVKGGLGVGSSDVEFLGLTHRESGLGVLAALGYEARLSKKFALGGEANFNAINTDTLDSANFASLNLMFNWYWSRD